MLDVKKVCVYIGSALIGLTASCAPVPLLPSGSASIENDTALVDISQPNAVCNHQFSDAQLRLKPNFLENEDNVIIAGDSGRELLRSLVASVPNGGTGYTKWDLKWSFESRRTTKGCGVRGAEAQVLVRYKLPLWPDQLFATDRDLTDQWNRYGDTLRAHHCKHGKTGIDASLEVKEALQAMAPRRDCAQLEADADMLARSIIGRYKQMESGFQPPDVTDYIN